MQSSLQLLCIALSCIGGLAATSQESDPPGVGPLEDVVPAEWMPLPVFVVPEIPIDRGRWKRTAGWAPRALRVRHTATDGVLEITLSEVDSYVGAPVSLRLERDAGGRLIASASGSTHTCVSSGGFFDLHGEVKVRRRPAGSSEPLRIAFRIDAIDDDDFDPLRTEGAVEIALQPGEWDVEVGAPLFVEADASVEPATLREVWWRWSDGTPRAHGRVDASGRRHGLWETWSASGDPESATEFLVGERHGLWRMFAGATVTEGRMEHGLQHGEWIDRYKADPDSRAFYRVYRNGEKVDPWPDWP